MQKFKLISLNIICIILLAYFTALAWQRVVAGTPYFDNDYKTFYVSLHANQKIYQPHFYSHVLSMKRENKKISLQTSPEFSAVNMNTPAMNFILRGLVNANVNLSDDVLLWMILSLFGAGISLYILQRQYFFPLLLTMWLSWPSLYDLKVGQVAFFVLPLLCVGFLLYQFKHWRIAAIVLGLLASLKLFFLIFILLFVARRQWNVMALFVASFLVFFFLPLLYFPWNDYHAFFQLTQHYILFIERSTLPMNGSLLGVMSNISRLWHPTSSLLQIRLSATILCLYLIIRWLIYDNNQLRYLPAFSDELRFSFLIVIALLCSPLGWEYYFLFLLIPIVVMIKISQRYALIKIVYVFFALSLILPYLGWMGGIGKTINIIQSFSVFAGLLCFLLCMCAVAKSVRLANLPTHNQSRILVGILVIFALISTLLLLLNYGMPYFLDPTQKEYLHHVGAVMQISRHH
ncbi:MAG: hypothetical protein ACD_42C00504G0001 [uncultured bacterium]|nr:MAG: hypothetical protein ACD_42C00504G0001 [uncultured bacterium]